jgi:hypothetical protein
MAAVSMAAIFTIVIAGWYLFRIESTDDRNLSREEPKQEILHDTVGQTRKTDALNVEQLREALPGFFEPVRVFDAMVLRSAERSIPEENYILASGLYNEHKYNQAARILEGLDRNGSFRDQDSIASLRYYLGHCYLNSGMATGDSVGLLKAVRTFKLIGRDSQYFYDARWYQSIALLKAGRIGEARSLLDSLLSNNYFRSGKVIALRNLLK